jgi:hypothetical protein
MTPALPREVAVPAQKRRRRHDQASTALWREQPSERRDETLDLTSAAAASLTRDGGS